MKLSKMMTKFGWMLEMKIHINLNLISKNQSLKVGLNLQKLLKILRMNVSERKV